MSAASAQLTGQSIEREPSSQSRVRLRDCDALAHLHNSTYIDYFMEAREDHLRSFYDFDVYEHARHTGQGWFVTGNQLQYFEPAAFNEEIVITTRLFACDDKRLDVEGRMYGLHKARLKALFWTRFRAVDVQSGRPRTHDDRVMRLCEQIVLPFDTDSTFEQRVAGLLAARSR